MAPLEVPTSAAPAVPTPTIFTVPLGVPPTYPAPASVEPTVYPAPPPPRPTMYPTPAAPVPPVPPVPTVHPAPAPVVPVAPFPIPPPTVPLAATIHIDLPVPSVVYDPVYAAAPGVPPPVYLEVLPVPPSPGISLVLASIPTHLTDIAAA
ncbi:36.4 kDa proline-rich protein-like [Zingiber officinale]|uniref:36.4 kDa proline-rich protein-like n=1 Tax=Zingiber officinale TaxID=94328 RepID=UPI001C4C7E42|nr:36.4 kDa proline-rich protein-like [Zingiber officinale]